MVGQKMRVCSYDVSPKAGMVVSVVALFIRLQMQSDDHVWSLSSYIVIAAVAIIFACGPTVIALSGHPSFDRALRAPAAFTDYLCMANQTKNRCH